MPGQSIKDAKLRSTNRTTTLASVSNAASSTATSQSRSTAEVSEIDISDLDAWSSAFMLELEVGELPVSTHGEPTQGMDFGVGTSGFDFADMVLK